ncbi:MAG: alpha/beta fold hydrolase [Pseudomonadota bacterium]
MLNVLSHRSDGAARPLLIAHGLFGSGRNWGAVGRALSDRGPVLAVDHRNHGQSPWYDTHSYEDLATDLAQVIAAQARGACDVLGHSMGGKAAMMLALTRPDLVARLIVVDIAPVVYAHDQTRFIDAMRAVDLSRVARRADGEAQLRSLIEDPMLASFFAQSLDLAGRRWRLNLDVLEREMPGILGFPARQARYDGPVLFLSGAQSEYVQPAHRAPIKALFPAARFMKIPDAGHWLHAERPHAFTAAVRAWLE